MILFHLYAITLALVIDAVVGDPPKWPHPVRWIGRLIAFLDTKLNRGRFRLQKGAFMLLFVVSLVGSITTLLVWFSYQVHPYTGILAEGIIISTTIARKSLKQAAMNVYQPLKQADLIKARKELSYIVGRDTEKLDESEITRGVVETVAENTSDGITAPMFWSLVGGAPLAMVYRVINTCDSMVGYRNEKYHRFGWCSAKTDDIVNWIPSRLTGLAMMVCNKPKYLTRKSAFRIWKRDAKKHPSPNSGWGEAAVAALLGVQLGGINYYDGVISKRSWMGDPIVSLGSNHILQTNSIMQTTVAGFICSLWIGGILYGLAISWF
ncbi:adenosylcobinamide-phosphate synthase CbiB [Bacillus sp. Marseille-Q3570]|uniref:adenosylcobinamide-phosphate synthase CbiB n=1 Tax=Bacillus sp. Marseille-Q3570 TaxID=2963522 RepID=UPI0021B7A18B|nr:adenosylcobinamide-phosphate synthase CbiB [Bacillus sp. Marseille-Q3570]